MRVKTKVKAGLSASNHNEALVRETRPRGESKP